MTEKIWHPALHTGTSTAQLIEIWHREVGAVPLPALEPEQSRRLCAYSPLVVASGLENTTPRQRAAKSLSKYWLKATEATARQWLADWLEFEAVRSQRPTHPCPRCGQTLGPHVCECGYRPRWVPTPRRALAYGDVPQLHLPPAEQTRWSTIGDRQ